MGKSTILAEMTETVVCVVKARFSSGFTEPNPARRLHSLVEVLLLNFTIQIWFIKVFFHNSHPEDSQQADEINAVGTSSNKQPDAGRGLWCSFLLPSALLSLACQVGLTEIQTAGCILTFASSLILLPEELFNKESSNAVTAKSILLVSPVAAIVLSYWTSYGILMALILSLASLYIFHKLCTTLLLQCPGSFTVGEAAIVTQFIIMMSVTFVLSLVSEITGAFASDISVSDYEKSVYVFIQVSVVSVGTLYMFPRLRTTFGFYVACSFIALATAVFWSWYLGQNAVLWLFIASLSSAKRIFLLLTWVTMSCASVLFVAQKQSKSVQEISTVTRKLFHIIIAAVYVPGLLLDPSFLYLASAAVFLVFIFLETVRVLQIPPIGPVIDDAYQIFLDEKDAGFLILTHIYLLVGCSLPLWMYPSLSGSHICHASGIISVAFGDTAASVAGTKFGKHRWKGSKKTIEGTVCAIIVQFVALVGLLKYGDVLSCRNVGIAMLSAVATSLLEANTTQVDNLVLPLFMFSFLSFVQ